MVVGFGLVLEPAPLNFQFFFQILSSYRMDALRKRTGRTGKTVRSGLSFPSCNIFLFKFSLQTICSPVEPPTSLWWSVPKRRPCNVPAARPSRTIPYWVPVTERWRLFLSSSFPSSWPRFTNNIHRDERT